MYTRPNPPIHHFQGPRDSDGLLHREDGPAIVRPDGSKEWYIHGNLDRDDGPAVERADGDREWFRNGVLHRDFGPALDWANGTKIWYRNGLRHREDGPAVEFPNGSAQWWEHDKLIATISAEALAVEDQARAENTQRDIDADARSRALTRLRSLAPHVKLKPGPRR